MSTALDKYLQEQPSGGGLTIRLPNGEAETLQQFHAKKYQRRHLAALRKRLGFLEARIQQRRRAKLPWSMDVPERDAVGWALAVLEYLLGVDEGQQPVAEKRH